MGQLLAIPIATFATLLVIISAIILISIAAERQSSGLKYGFYLTIAGMIILIIATFMAVFTAGGKTLSSTITNL